MGDINSLYGQLQGLGGQYAPVTSAMMSNPYAAGAQNAAGTAGAAGMGQGQAAIDAANGIYGQINGAMPYGTQLLQNAFDPQNALYARTLQQTTDQQNAQQSARGIAMSPYGAGLADENLRNFNIDWQNNQLGRQAQGLGAWTNFMQGQGQGASTAANLGQMGASGIQQGGALPYDTFSQIQQGKLGALGAQAQALGLPQTAIGDMLNYLQAGNSANANALMAQQQQNDMFGGTMGMLGGGLGMLLSPTKPWFL